MDVKIDNAIRQDRELLDLVQRVSRIIEEEIVPPSAAVTVTVEWSLDNADSVRDLVKLEISDPIASASFLTSKRSLSLIAHEGSRISLIRLWGDVLQERSHKQIEELRQIARELEGV